MYICVNMSTIHMYYIINTMNLKIICLEVYCVQFDYYKYMYLKIVCLVVYGVQFDCKASASYEDSLALL